MPVSLSEWRVRIGTYVPRNVDPSEEQEMGSTTTTEHQSSTNMKPSKPDKQDSFCGDSDEQETPTATSDNTKSMPCKTSKKRKRHNKKKSEASGRSSGAFLSLRCFMKTGASPLLRFMLLVFTAILLVRSGDVEVNPGPNETSSPGVNPLTLLNIAEAISDETKISMLGHHLGTATASIQMYLATNRMDGRVTSNGTRQMLVEWQERTGGEDQHRQLRRALVESSLRHVADQYLPADSPSDHVIAARRRTSLEMPNIATSIPSPSQPMNYSNQQPITYPGHNYQSSNESHQYAGSSAIGPLPFIYQRVHHPYMYQHRTPMPVIPPVFGTQGGFPPSYQMEHHVLQFQNQRLQPNHPSSSYGQFAPHVMASTQQNTNSDDSPLLTRQHGELNTYPNTQWYNPNVSSQSQNVVSYHNLLQPNTRESPGQSMLNAPNNSLSRQLASSQSCTNTDAGILPMVTQQERMHNNSSHINVQGSIYTSNPPQESPGPNMSRTLLVNSTSQQTASCRLTPEQPHSTMCAGPSQMRTQSGTLHTAAPTLLAHRDVPRMSSYQTPQNPSVAHPISLDLHEGYTYGTSSTVPDGTLLDIAKRIPQTKMYDVGIELGMDLSTLKIHRTTNTMGGAANRNGTLDMLEEWRNNASMEQQKELLRNALNASSLQAVAEEYLPEASRANPSSGPFNLKRTASGTPVQSVQVSMDSTSSTSNASLPMPSTSGHTSTYVPQNPSVPSTNCNNPITGVR